MNYSSEDNLYEEEDRVRNSDHSNPPSGFLYSIQNTLSSITIEPIIFLYVIAYTLISTLTTDLLLQRVCHITFNGSDAACANLSSNTSLQDDVEKETAQLNLYSDLVSNLPSVFLGPILGAYSDNHGRKLPMMLPFVGCFVGALISMVFAFVPAIPPLFVVACAIPRGLMGGGAIVLMACYSHVSDTTKKKSRTGRIGLVNVAMSLGAPGGLLLSSVLYNALGYWPVYVVSASLFLVALIYIAVRIDNNAGRTPEERQRLREQEGDQGLLQGALVTLQTVVKPRERWDRAALLLLLVSMLTGVSAFGSEGFTFLFTKKVFNWTYSFYINYVVITLLVEVAVSTLILYVLSYKVGVQDSWLGLVTATMKVFSYLLRAIAQHPLMLYISASLSCTGLIPLIAVRSLLSKSVPGTELGKVFSLLSTLESVLPVLITPAYTILFKATIDKLPGAVYFASTAAYMVMPAVFMFLLVVQGWGLRDRRAVGREAPLLEGADESEEHLTSSTATQQEQISGAVDS